MKRINQYYSCGRKERYDTPFEAEVVAANSNFNASHTNIEAYSCAFCSGWHVGHSRISRKKRFAFMYSGKTRCKRCGQVVKNNNLDSHRFNNGWCVKK